jgi:hypothetical protein
VTLTDTLAAAIMQMSCEGVDRSMGGFASGEWIQNLICTYAGAGEMTITAFGLVIWGTVSTMNYIRTQSLIMPMVLLILLGSVALTMVPAVGLGVAAILLLGGVAGVVVLLARRLDRV